MRSAARLLIATSVALAVVMVAPPAWADCAQDDRFTDDTCTLTTPWTEDPADARPASMQEVDDDPGPRSVETATSAPWIIIGVTVLVVVVAGAIAVARRRRERR